MANAQTVTTIEAVHKGIIAAIRQRFPELLTVEAYRMDRKNLPVPACLVELTEMEAADDLDPGTGQLAVNARFEARFVLGFRQGSRNPKMEVRRLAAEFLAWARLQRWGCSVGPAMVIGAWPDEFDPELDQYECWRTEWQQVIHLGASDWIDDGTAPTDPAVSFAPEVGADHEADYLRLDRGAPW